MKHRLIVALTLVFFIILIILKAEWWMYVLGILVFSLSIFLGVANMDFNYFQKNYCWNSEITENKIALSFDDGPTEFTPKFLTLLKKNNAKATFFCIGKQIEKYPDIFTQIIEDGHEIGNHSYSHSNKIGFFSTKKMMKEIQQNDQTILGFGKIKTELYRPPYGITNPNIASAIRQNQKKSIGWNIRSFDTVIKKPETIFRRVSNKIKPGSVILLHDTSEKTLIALEQILLFLEKKNYESIRVSELFKFEK